MSMIQIERAEYYRIIQSRDERYDNMFFFAVKSTGIYCQPSCPARRPLLKNCLFLESAKKAEEAGFRPCKRCTPNEVKKNKAQPLLAQLQKSRGDGTIASDAFHAQLADRHLRRLVKRETGFTPLQLHQKQRLHVAKDLLLNTNMKIIEVAFSANFSSLRQFNHAFKHAYGCSPRALRKAAGPLMEIGRDE